MMRNLIIGLGMLVSLLTGAFIGTYPAATAAALPAKAVASDVLNVCSGAASDSAVCKDKANKTNNPLSGKNGLLLKITRIVAIVAGVVAVIILIISGLNMMLASGDMQKVTKARNGFIYALIGLVVIVLAQAIVSFVASRALT